MKRPASLGVYAPPKTLEPAGLKSVEFSQSLMLSLTSTYGSYWSTYGAMYRQQPAVRAVVDFLARNIAQLNGKVYVRISDTDRMEANDHPLAELLRAPNDRTTRYSHMFATVADIAIYDRAYWRIARRGTRIGIGRVSPAKLLVEYDEARGQRVYRLDGKEIPRDELVVFPGYSPDTDAEGVSPLETLRRVLQEDRASQIAREAMQENAVRASGIIRRPLAAPEWTDVAQTRFRADVDNLLSGPMNAGKVALLEDGMTWEMPTFDAHHEEYVASRRLTYEEVAIVYFGPIGGRAWLETATATGSEENHRQMYQDVLGPFLRYMQDEIELQLLPKVQPLGRAGTYFEFNLSEKLKGSFEEQARVITTAVGVPSVSVNEGRARMNLPRIDDEAYDVPVQPLNVMYGGQPATTVPTADRSTPEPLPLMAAAAADYELEQRVRQILIRHLDRQAVALTSPKARAASRDRWDVELAADLAEVVPDSLKMAQAVNAETFAMVDAVGDDVAALRAVFEMTKSVRVPRIAAAA
jgi:HK97 family phage portal protein